ncbi:MAG: AmmeMemoRadiSam system radical SAM enzyme [Firmicutes bacterium HGW-Firmicutes-3]|jgi:pyruvate formate lyase activating enzyme|nr:MAG: AmmeMemoRadiSam system radical SAM enzyme [Firmicutes bacterium HGW-Firmicutes-3]
MKEAMFYKVIEERAICQLCPNNCIIKPDHKGLCQTRGYYDGKLIALNFGEVSGIQIDPIEKKPLAHWRQGSQILSFGSYGCNLKCPFCQNYSISREKPRVITMTPEAIVAQAIAYDLEAIAYTYNEPTVFYEMVYETAKIAHSKGIANVLVTNGYINEEPLLKLLPYIDAMNIDLKTYDDQKMLDMCGGRLGSIIDTIKSAKVTAHIELTMLIVPRLNDNLHEMRRFLPWLFSEVGDVPIHISRYFPAYEYDLPATDIDLMIQMQKAARQLFTHVYLGNVGD